MVASVVCKLMVNYNWLKDKHFQSEITGNTLQTKNGIVSGYALVYDFTVSNAKQFYSFERGCCHSIFRLSSQHLVISTIGSEKCHR